MASFFILHVLQPTPGTGGAGKEQAISPITVFLSCGFDEPVVIGSASRLLDLIAFFGEQRHDLVTVIALDQDLAIFGVAAYATLLLE